MTVERDVTQAIKKDTLRGYSYGYGIYSESVFVENKTLKRVHNWLRNCFRNKVIGKKQPLKIPKSNRMKYK